MYGNALLEKVFDIKEILTLHLQAIEIKNYAYIEWKCMIGLYPIIFRFNPIRIQFKFDLTYNPIVRFGSDFQIILLVGSDLEV